MAAAQRLSVLAVDDVFTEVVAAMLHDRILVATVILTTAVLGIRRLVNALAALTVARTGCLSEDLWWNVIEKQTDDRNPDKTFTRHF
ncbi:MAG: hypothetical protein ACK5Q5_13425 [Planctomycetaceae bacterium]